MPPHARRRPPAALAAILVATLAAAAAFLAACPGRDGDAAAPPEPPAAGATTQPEARPASRAQAPLPPLAVEPSAAESAAAGRAAEAAPPAPADAGPARLDAARDERRRRYVELAWRYLERLHRAIGDMGAHRNAAAALTAAALAERGGEGMAARSAAFASLALAPCAGQWHAGECERAALDLQRLAIDYGDVLEQPLSRLLNRELAQPAPPPGGDEIADPWSFAQTENQRAVTMARSLAAHAMAGTGGSPPARAWADYAVAFLAAHDRLGWYEADSPGYLGISIVALLHLHDFAPEPRVRQLAARQLNLLFADWALQQAGGMPAGPRSRTYAHWALGADNTPWRGWGWLLTGRGDVEEVTVGDWPEIALSGYRVPAAIAELAAERRAQGSYAVRERRRIDLARRHSVDAALYTWATPDYLLSASQAVDGLALAVSGGQEIAAWLLPESDGYAPLFLWSRHSTSQAERWRSRADLEQAVADENRLLARMGTVAEPGYAYLSPPWGRPEAVGEEALLARFGDVYVTLVTDGGWEVAPAAERFAGYFGGDRAYRGAWVAVPRRQPAAIALEAGRAAEAGGFAAWRRRAADLTLAVERDAGGELVELALHGGDGGRFVFAPGRRATVDGVPIDARSYPLHSSPFLAHDAGAAALAAGSAAGAWRFRFAGVDYRFRRLDENAAPRR